MTRGVLVTPARMSKADVRPSELLEVALDGSRRTSRGTRSCGEPSSEVFLDLRMYSRRPAVMAVVHAHPSAATGAFLLANHGAVALGPSLETAHERMEHAARTVPAARVVGRVNELTAEQMAALVAARARRSDVQSRSTARTSRRGKA